MRRTLAIAGAILVAAGLLLWRFAPGVDLALLEAIRTPAWTARPLGLFTDLGGLAIEGPIALAAAALLGRRRRWREAGMLAAAVVVGRLVVEGLKFVADRPRPPPGLHLAAVASLSMPSSHTACTSFTWLLVAAAFGGGWRIGVALGFATLIGVSRVALGVHYPSDVLAGWGVGLLWAALWWRAVTPPTG